MNTPFEQTILLNANPAFMKFHDQLHTIVRAFTLHQAVGAAVSRLSGNHYCILRFSQRMAQHKAWYRNVQTPRLGSLEFSWVIFCICDNFYSYLLENN